MSEFWKVTTEGDCEGRTTKNVGIFEGTKEQVAQYLVDNGIKPYYHFSFKEVKDPVTDVSGIRVNSGLELKDSGYGRVSIIPDKESSERAAKKKALGKLTDEEKSLLGLD